MRRLSHSGILIVATLIVTAAIWAPVIMFALK